MKSHAQKPGHRLRDERGIALIVALLVAVAVAAISVGAALLATDAVFLLTTTMDWGPNALQHLLLVGALFLLVRSYQGRRLGDIVAAMFLLGLAVWNKAIFLWILVGLLLALFVHRREVRKIANRRAVAAAAGGLFLGAAPFALMMLFVLALVLLFPQLATLLLGY